MDMETKEDLKEYMKEQGRIEKEKLKTMSFREKIDYIWTYYKAQIIIRRTGHRFCRLPCTPSDHRQSGEHPILYGHQLGCPAV